MTTAFCRIRVISVTRTDYPNIYAVFVQIAERHENSAWNPGPAQPGQKQLAILRVAVRLRTCEQRTIVIGPAFEHVLRDPARLVADDASEAGDLVDDAARHVVEEI